MTKEELAARINGREYAAEMTHDEEREAQDAGLLVIFGASDDLMEFRGLFHDEIDAWDGTTTLVDKDGYINPNFHEVREEMDEEQIRVYLNRKPNAKQVDALWCAEPEISWTFKTAVPHATFNIMQDGEVYCRGIVIDAKDL